MKEKKTSSGKTIAITVLVCFSIFTIIINILGMAFLGIGSFKDMRELVVLDYVNSSESADSNKDINVNINIDGITNSNDYNKPSEDTPPINTTPEEPSENVPNEPENNINSPDELSNIIYSKNGITVTLIEYTSNLFGHGIKVEISNESDKNITVSSKSSNSSVNNYTIEMWGSVDCLSGKNARGDLYFFSSDLQEYNINKIDTIEFVLYIYDSDNWTTNYGEEKITLSNINYAVD